MIAIQPFGDFKIKSGGEVMSLKHFKSKKVLSLIKFLIFNRNGSYSNDDLYEQFCFDSENPSSALKNLIYRAKLLLSETNLPDAQYIILKDGSYYWNGDVEIKLVNEEFEKNVFSGNNKELSVPARLSFYETAMEEYKDYFLPDIQYEKWVVPQTKYYHRLYISCVFNACMLYRQEGEEKKLETACKRAIKIDKLQENLYTMLIESLMKQNRYQEAYDVYGFAEKLFYDELGASLTAETKHLFKDIMHNLTNEERNIELIEEDLQSEEETSGAFVCSYEVFKSIYRVYARAIKRTGDSICVILATLAGKDGSIPEKPVILENMKIMEGIIKRVFRMGDVVARYSGTQFVIMLPTLSEANSENVLKRVNEEFRRKAKDESYDFSLRAVFLPRKK